MNPADDLAVYVLQAWLLLAGVGILAGRALRWWRRRRDPWQELARNWGRWAEADQSPRKYRPDL